MSTPTYRKEFKAFLDTPPAGLAVPAMEVEFYAGSDRPAVILQAANVENILQLLLERLMRTPLPSDLKDRLFDGNGPLSSFSNKTLVAYALGLFGPIFRHDMDIVRDLRNAFAHSRHPMSLTTPALAGMCTHLQLPDHAMRREPMAYGNLYPDLEVVTDNTHPRTRFTVACHTLSLFMIENAHGAAHTLP